MSDEFGDGGDGEVYHCDIHGFEAESRGQMQQHIDHEHPGGAAKDTPEEFLRADGAIQHASYLGFDHPNVGYVLDGEEDATVRYGLERELEVGEHVQLCTPSGNVFAIAEIEDVWACPLRLAHHDMTVVDGRNHPSESADDLWNRLQKHYGEVDYDDEVTVVYFDVIQVGGAR